MGLRDPQHEKFATLVGSGIEPEQAWREAHGRAPRGLEAKILAADSDVALRICEVQDAIVQQTIRATVLNKAWALNMLGQSVQRAFDAGKYATAIRGVELIGRLPEMQLFPSEKHVHHTHDHYDHMSEKEVLEAAIELHLLKPSEIPAQATRPESGNGNDPESH